MANSPNSHSDGEVREGFLCPICLHDQKTVEQLQEHFEFAHTADDQPVFQTLKGLFGKAKRKILKQDNDYDESSRGFEEACSFSGISPFRESEYLALNQEFGSFRSHTSDFKKIRDVKIDRYVIETNKLLIRLDRLITDAPDDPEKRKAHEKNIVHWVADADVKLCPGCAKSFGLSRRRHHCRLCGGVMCHSCSQFMDFTFARNLTQPVIQDNIATPMSKPHHSRRGSNVSLLSVVNFAGEPHIRICKDCIDLLRRRHHQIEQSNHRAPITQKYERMKAYMDEVEKLVPLYVQMIESLCAGETNYHLQDAQEVKIKISKMAEGIDNLSKIIAKLPPSQGAEVSNKSVQLQSSVRLAATQFLRNTVLGLPNIPTAEEVLSYKRMREDEIQKRIQQEKQAELQTSAKNEKQKHLEPKSLTVSQRTPKTDAKSPVSVEDGWSAAGAMRIQEEENPMLQQINIIHNYIKQARLDHKYDEVHMLEANLEMLQMEYLKQQRMTLT